MSSSSSSTAVGQRNVSVCSSQQQQQQQQHQQRQRQQRSSQNVVVGPVSSSKTRSRSLPGDFDGQPACLRAQHEAVLASLRSTSQKVSAAEWQKRQQDQLAKAAQAYVRRMESKQPTRLPPAPARLNSRGPSPAPVTIMSATVRRQKQTPAAPALNAKSASAPCSPAKTNDKANVPPPTIPIAPPRKQEAWELARSLARRRRQRSEPHHCAVLFEDDYNQWDVPTGHDTSAGATRIDVRIASDTARKTGAKHAASKARWRDACDVQQKLHALATVRDSLQNRLMPSNYEDEKAKFLAALDDGSGKPKNPAFTYERPLRDDELARRFPPSTEYLPEAKDILERNRSRLLARGGRSPRKACSPRRDRSPRKGGRQSMTPDELVASAEEYLCRCIPGDDWEAMQRRHGKSGSGFDASEDDAPSSMLSRRLIIHFVRKRQKKGSKGAAWQSIAVKGCVLRVPLPFNLTRDGAEALWSHELGTHFLRNYVNEPVTKEAPWRLRAPKRSEQRDGEVAERAADANVDKSMNLVSPSMAPFGSTAGVDRHVARMLWSRTCQFDPMRNGKLDQLKSGTLSGAKGGSPSAIAMHGAASTVQMYGPVAPPTAPEAPSVEFTRTWTAARRDNTSLADADAGNTRRITGDEGKRLLAMRELEEHACEEGLAVINQHLHQGENALLHKPALMYYAAALGQSLGFTDLFVELARYVPDASRRFAICARVKGGLCDTSKLQSTCGRDQCYLKGAIELLRKRREVDISFLHRGRITFDEAMSKAGCMTDDVIDECRKDSADSSSEYETRRTWHGNDRFFYPPHLSNMNLYRSRLDALAHANGL
ncbi:DUF1704 domain containing protein [Pycnococcus provasolii]